MGSFLFCLLLFKQIDKKLSKKQTNLIPICINLVL